MSLIDPSHEPVLLTRRTVADEPAPDPSRRSRRWLTPRRVLLTCIWTLTVLAILAAAGFFYARHWVRTATQASLPQIDGSLGIPGLAAPVTIQRDTHGVPHIQAASVDDLLVAQGFVTAQDRLFQMDTLRRHAAGELAEILGASLLGHDRLQRTLQIRAAADRAVAQLPPAQLHMLEQYGKGVNASISQQSAHLPIEFRVLRYQPAPWTPRDSILVQLAMFQDLTNAFPVKLAREALTSRLLPDQRAQLTQDLYPEGSWRDHPPTTPIPNLTIEGPPIEDVPLDESQSSLHITPFPLPSSLLPLPSSFSPGSNNWVVSGAHTASGKPLLSNDMHLSLTLPGIWYSADLAAPGFHAAGVTIPGLPLIVVGHNDHIAWGFTNLGADVQDVYIESTRGTGQSQEFLATDGSWQPVVHLPEPIKLKSGKTVAFEVLATRHGDTLTPILNPVLTADATHTPGAADNQPRTLSLRWTIYDPVNLQIPTFEVDSAHDWSSFLGAFRGFGGPAQNVVYADDQGHIGYHAMGRIPLRGPAQNPASAAAENLPSDVATPVPSRPADQTPVIRAIPNPLNATDIQGPPGPSTPLLSGPLSPVPLVPSAAHEWSGYIPFDRLPQIFDPPGGVIASANARTAPDDYPYPVTQNWAAAYRTERIYHLLAHSQNLTPSDMLHIQTDIYSDFDHVLAQRLAYALDHSLVQPAKSIQSTQLKTLHQAADLLRTFDGRMTTDSSAAAIVSVTHNLLWPMLLSPHLNVPHSSQFRRDEWAATAPGINALYLWGERDYALEQILMHTPPRWLPSDYANWDDFLTAVVLRALTDSKAPADLSKWRYGAIHTVDVEHPIFDQSEALRYLLGKPTGTGPQPLSGDGTTVKQVGHTFGPSERFTADLGDLDRSTLNLVLGQSGNPDSPWFLDQFPAWLHGTTFPLKSAATHTLTLTPN
jgi:penicillin amidase